MTDQTDIQTTMNKQTTQSALPAVRKAAFHAVNTGSNPVRSTNFKPTWAFPTQELSKRSYRSKAAFDRILQEIELDEAEDLDIIALRHNHMDFEDIDSLDEKCKIALELMRY